MTLTELVAWLNNRRAAKGLGGTVRAIKKPWGNPIFRNVLVVYQLSDSTLIGETVIAPKPIDWTSPRPKGVISVSRPKKERKNQC